jgi:hypothetical protein
MADLEKHLFRELYPFVGGHFSEAFEYMKSDIAKSELDLQNIAFMVKLTKYSIGLQDRLDRDSLYFVYDRLFSNVFRLDRYFDWNELKIILCFFVLVNDVANQKDFEQLLGDDRTAKLLKKYYHQQDQDSDNNDSQRCEL